MVGSDNFFAIQFSLDSRWLNQCVQSETWAGTNIHLQFSRFLPFERWIEFPMCLQCLSEATYQFSRCLEVSRLWFSLICRKWSGSVSTMNRFEWVESARIWLAPKFRVSWPESMSEGQTYHDSGWTKRSRCRELDWTTLKNSLGYVTK